MSLFRRFGDRFAVSFFLSYAIFVLVGYAAWARGGIYAPFQWPLVSWSVLMLGMFMFFDAEALKEVKSRIFHDPVFYIGLGFLSLLIIQSANTGYYVMWDEVKTVGMPKLPSCWIPWSVEPNTAGQMFNWFFPAWTVIIIIRHVLDRSGLKVLLYLMAWNAALLAIIGMVQEMVLANKMLGLWQIPGNHFFATFGYVNHAAAWFYLHAALAAGLAHDAINKQKPIIQTIVWCGCFFLCIAATFFTLSRAGALCAMILLLGVAGIFIRWAWRKSTGSGMLNALGLVCIIVLVGITLYLGVGKGSLASEIEKTFSGEGLSTTVEGRAMQWPSAFEIVQDYPIFGCGGWGYRWIVLLHIPVSEWDLWRGGGRANVHCDPLQFLVEFGGVGVLCLLAIVGFLIRSTLRIKKRGVLQYWIAAGLVLVFLHSWVDLPFRSPAILLAWCVLIAVLGRLDDKRRSF